MNKDIDKLPSIKELAIKDKDYYLEFLKDKNLLINVLKEIQNIEGVVGNELAILVLINKVMMRLGKNITPTSSNIWVSDKTGSGKDFVTDAVLRVLVSELELVDRTCLSDKALNYWGTDDKKKSWTWDNKLLKIEDPPQEFLKTQSLRVLASGKNKISTVIKGKIQHYVVNGKPPIIITSYNSELDVEGMRRWDAVRVDTSPELTGKILDHVLNDELDSNPVKPNFDLRTALKEHLERYEVFIPFKKLLRVNIPNDLFMRTQIHRLLDYIKASALFFQYQREIDDHNRLIATIDDYHYAYFMFNYLKQARALNIDEEGILNIFENKQEPLSIPEIANLYKKKSQSWIYEHIDNFINKGLLEIGESFYNENAHKYVTRYQPTRESALIGIPDVFLISDTLLEYQMKGEKTGKRGSIPVFHESCIYINKERERKGLPSIPTLINIFIKNTIQNSLSQQKEISIPKPSGIHKNTQENQRIPLSDRISELKNYCENLSNKSLTISYDTLVFNFDAPFIEKCKEERILIPSGNGYVFNGGG